MALDAVKIDGRFRLCYGGTEELAMVAPDKPVDTRFKTRLTAESLQTNGRVFELVQKSSEDKPGYANGGQANRAIAMIQAAKIEIVPLEEVAAW